MMLRSPICVFVFVACGSAALAQEPTPPPRDTARAPGDTAKAPVVQDTVRPIPQLAKHYLGPALGLSDAVWVWEQPDLLLETSMTLGELLDRIPGILRMRTGVLIQPEAISVFGSTANRLEVFLDGYQFDPFTEASVDITKLELVNIERVRVERRIGLIRIYIETVVATDNRAYTRVEAGVGEPESNMFRGILLAPKLFFGPFGVSLDRMDTDGTNRQEPADQFAGWVKWAYIRGKSGFQIEYRRMSTDRDPNIPWDVEHTRDDLIGQLRLNITNGVVAELFGGRSTFEADTLDPAEAEDTVPKVNEETFQFGGRASFETPFVWAHGTARLRDNEAFPSLQVDGSGGLRVSSIASIGADVTFADWRDAGTALWYSAHGSIAPIAFVRAFGEYTSGDRGAPWVYGTRDQRPFISGQTGYRVGGELKWRNGSVGGAYLHSEADSVPVFGLPFDTIGPRVLGGHSADGWEVSGITPSFLHGFAIYGNVVNWMSGVGLYMPTRTFRVGLQHHSTPLRSGNLELYGRIELNHRGSMITPFAVLPEFDVLDAYLQIRIIDVRIFGRFEDMLSKDPVDVGGRIINGPRLFYGVKWHFWN